MAVFTKEKLEKIELSDHLIKIPTRTVVMKYVLIILSIFFSASIVAQTSYPYSKRSSDVEIQESIDKHLSQFNVKAIKLLETGKYAELIDHMSSLELAFNEDIGKEVPLSWEIYSIYDSEKKLSAKLDDFVLKYPDHFLPYLLRGTFNVGQGWIKRGGKYYDDTTKTQLKGMDYFHMKALPDLEKTLEIRPDFMHSYLIRAAVYRPRGATAELMWNDLKTAFSLKKASFDTWTEILKASMPRWYGNEKILEYRLSESQKLVDLNPRLTAMRALVARNYAEKYWYAGEKEKALEAYMAADKLGDHWWITSEVASELLYSGKNNNLACEYTDKAISLEPYSKRSNRFSLYCEANRKLGFIK